MCESSVREEANNWLGGCLLRRCQDTDQQAETLTLFKNYCDGLYASGVSVGSDTTGPTGSPVVSLDPDTTGPTQSMIEHPSTEHTVTATKTVTQTEQLEATKTAQTSPAQRGVPFLWDGLTMLVVSLVAMVIWGVGWGGVAV